MSRADDDTQVDYSLLDDAALGNAIAERVLCGIRYEEGQDAWIIPEPPGPFVAHIEPESLVSWWGAGLVIDAICKAGHDFAMKLNCDFGTQARFEMPDGQILGSASAVTPFRAILLAALRAKTGEE